MALVPTFAAHAAATYYVATNGNDQGPGTKAMPWRTVARAVGAMFPGDTTYVRGGLYNEGLITFSRSGTASAPIRLLNAPNESPVIDFGVNPNTRTPVHRFQFASAGGYNKPIGWIVLEGFEIRNGYDGIKYYNLHDAVIRKNNIHHNSVQGIKGNGSLRVLIDQNTIHANGNFVGCAGGDLTSIGTTVCNQTHGIYIDGKDVTITNNLIYNNLCLAIVQNGSSGYSSTGHAGPEFAGAQNWLIANNTLAYQYYCPAISVWGPQTSNTRIINNIFHENGTSRTNASTNGISLYSSTPASGLVIKNNLSYATGSGGTTFIGDGYNSYTEGVHYTQSGNIINTLAPKFLNAPALLPAVPNFRLSPQSPAINKGLNVAEVKTDIEGKVRPQGAYDIGAYEFAISKQPSPAQDLQVR